MTVTTQAHNEAKAETLAHIEGFETVEALLKENMMGMGRFGICTNKGCEHTSSTDQDSWTEHCEECNTNTVANACVLMGIQ